MEMIIAAGIAMLALLVLQHRKGFSQRVARARTLRNEPSTYRQTNVPEDRC